jgi:uncharacterized membrane protein YdjX (TVP38/TMEM64 family)
MAIRRPAVRFAILAASVAALAVATLSADVPSVAALNEQVSRLGWWVPLVAVTGTAVLVTAMAPRTALAAAAGLLFGPVAGAAYVLVGALVGATVAFGAGRWLGREFLLTRRRFHLVDRSISGGGSSRC